MQATEKRRARPAASYLATLLLYFPGRMGDGFTHQRDGSIEIRVGEMARALGTTNWRLLCQLAYLQRVGVVDSFERPRQGFARVRMRRPLVSWPPAAESTHAS